jgi:hypothetical protein
MQSYEGPPQFEKDVSARSAATIDWPVSSFCQPNAALLAAINPQVCSSIGPWCNPRESQCFAAAWASRLQLTVNLPHQVSYRQHATPQIPWSARFNASRWLGAAR